MMWKKEHVELIPQDYAEKFPEDLGECLLCHTPGARYMSVQNIAPDDKRIPAYMRGINVMFAFAVCLACYALPDIETRVTEAIAAQKDVV